MAQVLIPRRSLAASAPLTDEEIKKQRWRKHIEEISRHLATERIQSQYPTYEQKQWRYFRMSRPFPKPYRPHQLHRDSVQVDREGGPGDMTEFDYEEIKKEAAEQMPFLVPSTFQIMIMWNL